MTTVTSPPPPSAPPASPLWRDLADGSAGWLVRLVATVALAAVLTGLVPILAYFLAAWNRAWNQGTGPGIYPEDGLVAFLTAMAAGGFLAASWWLWTRGGRRQSYVSPVVITLGIVAGTIALSVLAEDTLPGDRELVVLGLVFLGGAGIMLVWLSALRHRLPRRRALRHRQDGLPDVRCPTCDYRMVGLTESRCPECGTTYTLDELISRQGFVHQNDSPQPPAPSLRSA
jgi:hypothetical protein